MILQPKTGSWRVCILLALCLMSLLGVTHCVLAQELRDPTRPPGIVMLPAGSVVGAPPSTGLQLQSVRISAHRASAIISGQQVRVGDQVGSNRVIAISENDVTLRGPDGVQTLKLFSGISKRPVPSGHRHTR